MSEDNAQRQHQEHDPNFFEGTEKKVELAIDPELPSLRAAGDDYWTEIVARSQACILSKMSNDRCDAYLLSESSLFVLDHKLVMITCGRTRLTEAVHGILERIGTDHVELLVYERKNEVFPHNQPTSFFDDMASLGRTVSGRAFQFGDEYEHHLYLYHLDRPHVPTRRDTTIEVLMYDIDGECRRMFRPGAFAGDRARLRRESGVESLTEGFQVDDHLFEPSGYSLNAIRDEDYFTAHVTPDELRSYASVETNGLDASGLDLFVRQVLDVFRPRAFDLITWDSHEPAQPQVVDYRTKARVTEALSCGYRVSFANFYRPQKRIRRAVELLPSPLEGGSGNHV